MYTSLKVIYAEPLKLMKTNNETKEVIKILRSMGIGLEWKRLDPLNQLDLPINY